MGESMKQFSKSSTSDDGEDADAVGIVLLGSSNAY